MDTAKVVSIAGVADTVKVAGVGLVAVVLVEADVLPLTVSPLPGPPTGEVLDGRPSH